jgi:hypothetical protein
MHIRLFEIEEGAVKPTEHCYMISWLNQIIEDYPEEHLKVLAYIFYMTNKTHENPYANVVEEELEERIQRDLQPQFFTEDAAILLAIDKLTKLYETPTIRAYNGIKVMLDNMSTYLANTEITDGRDGNIRGMLAAAKDFKHIQASFKGAMSDVEEETKVQARGKSILPYDMRRKAKRK